MMRLLGCVMVGAIAILLTAFGPAVAPKKIKPSEEQTPNAAPTSNRRAAPKRAALTIPQPPLDVAIFAGGCFWCMEAAFEKVPGVFSVISGYTGGEEQMPTYTNVAGGKTGHQEAVWVVFHPDQTSYKKLLEVFWQNIDPTQKNGQFADIGKQYLSLIFYRGDQQKVAALASKEALVNSGKFGKRPIVTALKAFEVFWPAERYHQDYYRFHPEVYERYYEASGRGPFVREHWALQTKDAVSNE